MATIKDLAEQYGVAKAQDQNENLGRLAEMLGSARDIGNEYKVPSWVPLAGGTGAGDLLMGRTPEEIENWSYGNAPMQIPEMSNVPQFKRGRAQSLADALTTLAPGVKATEDLPVGMAIKAYHGTPHLFDRFDMSKLGTGEGAQSYGHGLYFAQNPNIAESYRKKLSDAEYKTKRGGDLPYGWKSSINEMRRNGKSHEDVVNFLQGIAEKQTHPNWKAAKKLNERIQKGNVVYSDPGRIYETSIQWPSAEREAMDPLGEHHLLDWDRPAEGYVQESIPRKIRELQNARDAISSKYVDDEFNPDDLFSNTYSFPSNEDKAAMDRIAEEIVMHKNMSPAFEKGAEGSVTYSKLVKMLGSPEKASEYLHTLDIPGIKYLDATSRSTDKGTRNFVTFGDEYPQIVKRAGSLDELQEKNLNKRLIKKYLSEGKLSPDDMAQYEQNALAMETPLLQRYNVENALANPNREAYKNEFDDQDYYHGTSHDFKSFKPSEYGRLNEGVYVTPDKTVANMFSKISGSKRSGESSNTMPLKINPKNVYTYENYGDIPLAGTNNEYFKQKGIDALAVKDKEMALFNPSMIRSRFAAFDPLRKNSSSIMASGLLGDLALKYANDDEPKYAEGGIVDKLKSQDFGPNDSVIISSLMHPQEAAGKAGDWLQEKMRIASGRPYEDNFTPDQQAQAGLDLAGLMQTGAMPFAPSSAGGTLGMAIKGYHGSPHKFKEFDTAHMGTGEGGQAYGWGNYITEDPYVATTYSPQDDWMDEQLMNLYNQAERRQDYPSMEVYERYMMHERPNEVKEYLNESYADYPEDLPKRLPAQKIGENLYKKQKGSHLYEVSMEFPKEREAVDPMSIEHFLDYDKPLSEQSDYVKNILQRHDPDMYHPEGPDYDPAEKGNSILQRFGSGKEGAQKLYELGIPGTTYMGEKAKVANPEGVRNFVTYSDEVPRVVTRNMNKVKPLTDEDRLNDLEKQMSAYMKTKRMPKGVDFKSGSDWYDWAYDKRAKLRGYAEGGSVDKDSLQLNKPRRTPNHPTKSHIVKTMVDGKEKIIRFGEQGAETAGKPKEGESDRMTAKRESFKARHAKNIAKGPSSAAYWANKVKWAEGGEVDIRDDEGYEDDLARLKRAYENSNFGPNDSMIASTIRHPAEAAKRYGQHLNDMYAIATDQLTDAELAAAKDAGYDEESYPLYAMEHPIFRTDAQKAEAGMEFAGLAQTGAMPFAPESAGGVLGMLIKPMKASEAYGRIEGQNLNALETDRTKVGKGFLGGVGYTGLQHTSPPHAEVDSTWGVQTPSKAATIINGTVKPGQPDPVFTTFIGSPDQHKSNNLVFDLVHKNWRKASKDSDLLTPELIERMNERLATHKDYVDRKTGKPLFPADINVLSKNLKDYATTFDRRAALAEVLGGKGVGGKKGQIFDYDKVIRDTTDPALLDVPSGSLGNRLFTLNGGILTDRYDLNPAFPTILQGKDFGLIYEPVPRELVFKDFVNDIRQKTGRDPGYMHWTRGYPPSQLITEDLLTEMQRAGYAKGGEVKALHDKYEESDYGYGNRPDKTKKGLGYFGELERPDGTGVMTEYSIGVPIHGEEMDVPTLVPTLTPDEIRLILHMQDGDDMPRSIVHKAIDHAHQRLSEGKPIFATEEDLYAHGGIVDVLHNDAIEQIMKAFMDSMADDEKLSAPAVSIEITTQNTETPRRGKIPKSIAREAKHG